MGSLRVMPARFLALAKAVFDGFNGLISQVYMGVVEMDDSGKYPPIFFMPTF